MDVVEERFSPLPSQLGFAAGAAGWSDGHTAVRDGALTVDACFAADTAHLIEAFAAPRGREQVQRARMACALTPAQAVRIYATYIDAFIHGALDQAGCY